MLLRLQAVGQCGQALQADSQAQGQHGERARHQSLEDVLDAANTSWAILADKGKGYGERKAWLTDAGWRSFIQRKGGKALRNIDLARATPHLNWTAATYTCGGCAT